MGKNPRIEFAPRERIRFAERLKEKVLEVIGFPEALVTDESRLTDFLSIFDIERSCGPGDKPGRHRFRSWRRIPERACGGACTPSRHSDEWRELIEEQEPEFGRREIIGRILAATGVDVTDVFEASFPELLHFIATHIPDEQRAKLMG